MSEEMIKVRTPRCIVCDAYTELTVRKMDFDNWRSGTPIQLVWPDWEPSRRELLQTGTHPLCWDELLGSGNV